MPRFVVTAPCWRGDCACRAFEGLESPPAPMPPVHNECTCYLDETPPAPTTRRGFLFEAIRGGRLIGVLPLTFGRALIGVGRPDAQAFDDVWDFPSRVRALAEAAVWDPAQDPEPNGWDRHPSSGRYRTDGDPAREYRKTE